MIFKLQRKMVVYIRLPYHGGGILLIKNNCRKLAAKDKWPHIAGAQILRY